MQILKIKLSKDEENELYNELTRRFKLQDERQVIGNSSCYDMEWESELELYTELSDRDENNQRDLLGRSVVKFRLTFYRDGDEVEVVRENRCGDCIEDRIKRYYEV